MEVTLASVPGKVYLVGAGPGDVGLLTLKGRDLLRRCHVVLYDDLVNRDILAFASPTAELKCVGTNHQLERLTQDEIQDFLIQRARAGKMVVRLKGGDPFIFGRGGEEAEALTKAGIVWEVVPGVSAGHAVPAYAGIPLTHRAYASSVAFVTGHECDNKHSINWNGLACTVETLVIFMGGKNLAFLVAAIRAAGKPDETPIAVIERGTCPDQRVRVATLGSILDEIQDMPVKLPALIVVGNVVDLQQTLNASNLSR